MLDLERFIPQLHDYIARAIRPLQQKIDAQAAEIERLKAERPERGEKGDPGADGKSLTVDDVLPMLEMLQAKHALELERRMMDRVDRIEVRDGIDGRDGMDADEDAIAKRVLETVSKAAQEDVQKAIAAIPAPEHGRDGIDGRDGQDGRDADEEAILGRLRKDAAAVISRAVAEEAAKIPLPQDGRDGIDGKDGAPGINGKDGSDGLSGKDGEKGLDGRDGQNATPEMVDASVAKHLDPITARLELNLERKTFEWMERTRDEVRKMIDAIPKPRDGIDGISAKDIEIEYDGERHLLWKQKTATGEIITHTIYLPIPLYREVWKADFQYSQHDMVTHDGSTWIATQDSKGVRPGHMQKAWKLIVKKGRDGK
jgi:hypothetical protein